MGIAIRFIGNKTTEGFSIMHNQLFQSLQAWFETGMPLSFSTTPPLPLTERGFILPSVERAETIEIVSGSDTTATYSLVSHQNVYHPRRVDTLLLRSGQTVSTSLLQKLCQFGINIATFCSLKERRSGVLHPITDETLAWLPDDYQQPQTQTLITHPRNNRQANQVSFMSLPVRLRFEETLKALKACPMPNLLVLNPLLKEQRKLGRLLEAIGVEYQQVHPVLTPEMLSYLLRRYTPHTLMIDQTWWDDTDAAMPPSSSPLENTASSAEFTQPLVAFVATLIEQLQSLATHQSVRYLDRPLNLVFMMTPPPPSHREALVNALALLSPVAAVRVVWKPCKRQFVKEALSHFLQATDLQLERRQEEQSFVRLVE
jgi:hypothetical protein